MSATMTITAPEMWAEKEAQLIALIADKDKRIAALEAFIKKLQRHQFGQRSERLDPNQAVFAFVEAEMAPAPLVTPPFANEAPDAEEPAKATKKRGHGRRLPPADLPRERTEILPPESERHCGPCGCDKVKIGEELTAKMDYVPASLVLRETVRVKLACPKCQLGVAIAAVPPAVITKGEAGEGLLAHVIVSKYADHLPLHRQEAILARHGVEIDRSTMCDWVAAVAAACEPIVASIRAEVLASYSVHLDDTPVKVQDRSLKGRTATGHLWTTVGENGDGFFTFTPDRSRDGPVEILKGYRGFVHADAYSGHDELYRDGTRVEIACWAHTRRYFYDARDSAANEAAHALATIQLLYRVKAEAKQAGADPERIKALRMERSQPLLLDFESWLDEQAKTALPKSPLGEAIGYARRQWTALNRYVTDGRLSIDNNAAERSIRMIAVGRKNWLFCGSHAGGHRAAILYTLIANCKAQKIDPFAYLRDLLGRLPHAKNADHHAELTPRAWKVARDHARAATSAS